MGRSPEGGDTERLNPGGNNCRGSVAHHRTDSLPMKSPGWLLASPVSPPEGRTDWLLSPHAHDKRASHRDVVVKVVVVVVVVPDTL